MGVLAGEVWFLIALWFTAIGLVVYEPTNPWLTIPITSENLGRYSRSYKGAEYLHNEVPEGTSLLSSLTLSCLLWWIMVADSKDRLGWTTELIAQNTRFYVLGLLFTSGCAIVSNRILRYLVGEASPDYLSRCFGISSSQNLAVQLANIVSPVLGSHSFNEIPCTTNESPSMIWEGRHSFPSGQVLVATATLLYTGMSINKHCMPTMTKVIALYLVAIALMALCTSRVALNRQHPVDVIFALILGFFIACTGVIKYWLVLPSNISDEKYSGDLMGVARTTSADLKQPLKDIPSKLEFEEV